RYPVHLENALSELGNSHTLTTFIEENPYKETVAVLRDMVQLVNHKDPDALPASKGPSNARATLDKARELIEAIRGKSSQLSAKKKELEEQEKHYLDLMQQIAPFCGIHFPISKILDFKFIKFRFGRIALNYYDTFS